MDTHKHSKEPPRLTIKDHCLVSSTQEVSATAPRLIFVSEQPHWEVKMALWKLLGLLQTTLTLTPMLPSTLTKDIP